MSDRSGIYKASTENSYNVYRKKFSEYVGHPFEQSSAIPNEIYTDENVAGFFNDLGPKNEFKPHIFKTAKAAINSDLLVHGRRGIQDSPTEWRLTTLEFKKWETKLKECPYFPESASPLSKEAVEFIFNLVLNDTDTNTELLQRKAYLCWAVYCGMRNEDIYNILSSRIQFIEPDPGCSTRRIRTVIPKTKNDPMGTGPEVGREHFLPCLCSDVLSGPAKRKFLSQLQTNIRCPCAVQTCPYGIVNDYLRKSSDAFDSGGKGLRFMRSKTTRGEVKFTLQPMDLHTLAKIIPSLNDLLPDHLKCGRKVTGHSGRHTAASIAVNAGVDSVTVAKTTKHKDPKMLSKYVLEDENKKLSTAKAIGTAVTTVSSSSSSLTTVQKRFEDECETDDEVILKPSDGNRKRSVADLVAQKDGEDGEDNSQNKKLSSDATAGGSSFRMPVFNFNFYSSSK